MFGELPKLFGRNFAVGFLLPIVAFGYFTVLLLEEFDLLTSPLLPFLLQADEALLATTFILILWLGGILLLALNHSILRLKEGYGTLNPALLFAFVERYRYKRLVEKAGALEAEFDLIEKRKETVPRADERKLNGMRELLAWRFPHDRDLLLRTAFGNTIRGFEVYSAAMYGLDAIPAWPRLLMVMPDNNRELVDTAKNQMNFWVNLWFLGLVFLAQYAVLRLVTGESRALWALIALPLAWLASRRSRSAARMWGETVKAAFDVYTPQLRRRLGMASFPTHELEVEHWRDLSSAMLYRNPDRLPPRLASESGNDPDHTEGG